MTLRVGWRMVLIIISAAAIAFSVYSYLESLQHTVKVVVAAEDIPAHTVITEDMLEIVEIELNSAKTLLKDPVDEKNSVVNSISLVAIGTGEAIQMDPDVLIFPEQVEYEKRVNGEVDITYFIPKEKRLTTVAVDLEGSAYDYISIGDWIDVIYSDTSDSNNSSASMILQQLEVYDVEDVPLDEGSNKQGVMKHITLLVSPQEAVLLSLAKRKGNIDLILNPWNGEQEKVIPVYDEALH